MKRISLIWVLVFCAAVFFIGQIVLKAYGDFDDDFSTAARMNGNEAAMGTDSLVKNTTEVLHKENMAILSEIQKLHQEIAALEKDIKDVKDIVEGGH